jgi:hypothetical protein
MKRSSKRVQVSSEEQRIALKANLKISISASMRTLAAWRQSIVSFVPVLMPLARTNRQNSTMDFGEKPGACMESGIQEFRTSYRIREKIGFDSKNFWRIA